MNTNSQSAVSPLLVTVLMPCLNEARTLAACIDAAHQGAAAAVAAAIPGGDQSEPTSGGYEVIVADNGSTDGSQEIARQHGARVVEVTQRGYGAALQGGIAAARGRYVVMGDADCSYDFDETPRFVQALMQSHDLVMGNRFAGGILPGAMPWLHRYVGNPLLSGMGRLLYRTPCRDWHCGLRGFDRQRISDLGLACPGMEFASEMVIAASQAGYRISELPVILAPDDRGRPPHLRSFRDGWRHLRLMLARWHLPDAQQPPNNLRLSPQTESERKHRAEMKADA